MNVDDRRFLDTNVLVYLFDRSSPKKQARAREIVEEYGGRDSLVISTQVLQEFYVTVTRKLAVPLALEEAEQALRGLTALAIVEVETDLVLDAAARSRKHKLSFWDALIVEAALVADCRALLTEDMQDGREFRPLRVENPFL